MNDTPADGWSANLVGDVVRRSFTLAHEFAASLIKCEGVPTALDDDSMLRWYDTRPMLDLREHSPTYVDINAEAINFALQVGLAAQHPQRPYLLRLVHGRHITEEAAG